MLRLGVVRRAVSRGERAEERLFRRFFEFTLAEFRVRFMRAIPF